LGLWYINSLFPFGVLLFALHVISHAPPKIIKITLSQPRCEPCSHTRKQVLQIVHTFTNFFHLIQPFQKNLHFDKILFPTHNPRIKKHHRHHIELNAKVKSL
jgi:hypothetical protein